jgi:aspartyl-tRNA(Asn)/glutamyl-tRNA(Gln) amidotransferase subunit A
VKALRTALRALSVPFTFSSEQVPVNVQLVAKWLDEASILRLGLLIESGNKANNRRPTLSAASSDRAQPETAAA